MTVETITNGIEDLDPNFPAGTDPVSEGDNHARNTKLALGLSFPNSSGAWNTTSEIQANGFNAKTFRVRNVGTPTDVTDAVRKGDTDALEARIQNLENQSALFQSFGNINGQDGTIFGGTGDFSVVRNSEGVYTITFSEAASSLYTQSMSASSLGLFNVSAEFYVIPTSVTTWQVSCYAANGQLTDNNISFIRVAN